MNWKLLIRIGVFATFTLSVASLITIVVKSKDLGMEIYQLKQENTQLKEEITALKSVDSVHDKHIATLADVDSGVVARLDGAEAKLDVLDTAIHPDKKRQQRLLQTRDAILDHLHGGNSIKACGQLSPWDVYRMAGWFVDYTDRYGVDLNLALAVARRESAFCQKAVSRADAVGIMQIMDDTADDLARRIGLRLSRHRTEDNIRMGVYYLGQLQLDFKGNTELAVKSYNMGPHNVKRVVSGELSDYFKETKEYWEFVRQYKKEFRELGL